MKTGNWSKTTVSFVLGAMAAGILILAATSYAERRSSISREKSSLTLQQGQEIRLDNNLRLVIEKIEGDAATITLSGAGATLQPTQTGRSNPDRTDNPRNNPCPCTCPPQKDPGGKG